MERKRERRKILLAIIASIFLHLVIAYSLVAMSQNNPAEPLADENKPTELTLMDLSPAAPAPRAPVNAPYMETDPTKESAEKPKEQTFESNANSIAASSKAGAGDEPLPSQDGKERPFTNLETHSSSLPTEGAQPQPTPRATPAPELQPTAAPAPSAKSTPAPTQSPIPASTPEPEQFAMLAATPTPPPPITTEEAQATATPEMAASPLRAEPRPQPQAPASSYQAERQQTRISGRISDRGPSAVNAVGTPLGRYQKAITDAIGSRWYYYINSKIDLVNIGTAHVEAEVDANGKVKALKILSNSANEAFANICLQSFQEARIPPIPPELAATLPDGKMPVDFYFTTYANR